MMARVVPPSEVAAGRIKLDCDDPASEAALLMACFTRLGPPAREAVLAFAAYLAREERSN